MNIVIQTVFGWLHWSIWLFVIKMCLKMLEACDAFWPALERGNWLNENLKKHWFFFFFSIRILIRLRSVNAFVLLLKENTIKRHGDCFPDERLYTRCLCRCTAGIGVMQMDTTCSSTFSVGFGEHIKLTGLGAPQRPTYKRSWCSQRSRTFLDNDTQGKKN